ncbi:MAG: hypothetical protein ACYSUC_11750 [Planctomycetota bacterium]|jgi:hypothetical protein
MAYKIKAIRFTLEKARRHQVIEVNADKGRYEVTSANSGNTYQVSLQDIRCTCDRDQYIGKDNGFVNHCSHVQAAFIYRALKADKWLVARNEDADVSNLKRQVVVLRQKGQGHGDGVKWTARKIDKDKAQAKIEQFEKGPRHLENNFIRKIARKSSKRVAGQEAPELVAA